MRIDNNNILGASNEPELPYKGKSDHLKQKVIFDAPPAGNKPKTEEQWLEWLFSVYNDILRQAEEGKDPSKQPPLDLSKLEQMYQEIIQKIEDSFKDRTNISPEFIRDFLDNIEKEIIPTLTPEKKDSFSNFVSVFVYQIDKEKEKLTNYQKEEVARYQQEIAEQLSALIEKLSQIEGKGSYGETVKAFKEAIAQLEGQLKELEKTKTSSEFFSKNNINSISGSITNAKTLSNKLNKGDDFPLDPKKDTFDTSIPRKPDGSIDMPALIKKLQDLLYYMYHGDCGNFNIYTAIAGYLTNVAGVWDELSDTDKASFNKLMGSVPEAGGKSLGQILAESVIYGKFFDLEKNKHDLTEFINRLIKKLDGKDSPFIEDFLKGIKNVRNGLTDWINSHKDMNYKDFLREQTLRNASIGKSSEMEQLFNSLMQAKIRELEALSKGDPFLLFYLLLMLLFQDNDKYETQISGVGKTIEKLNELGGEAAKLGELFQKICERVKTDKTEEDFRDTFDLIKKFMDGAKAFCNDFKDDPRLSSSFSELEDAFKRLFSHDPEEGLAMDITDDGDNTHDNPYVTPDGKTKTIGEVFDEIAKTGSHKEKADFARHFQEICCPGKADESKKGEDGSPLPPPIGKHFTQLTSDIQAFTKAPLNMNSTMTIKMEEIKATSEQFGAMITKFAKEPNDLIHRMMERIQK